MSTTNLETAKRYITHLSSGAGPEELADFFSTDFVQEEFPNRLMPNGATRDLQAMKAARARGKALLTAERFQILNAVATDDLVAMELVWTGTVGHSAGPFTAGQELRARFAIFMNFRNGQIARQRNYDCFDPW
jgi:ketosteroid isomerase-like protein